MKSVNNIVNITGLSRQRINQLIEDGQIKATLFGRKMYMIEDCDFEDFRKKRVEYFRKKSLDSRLKKS
jgi:hypothetical protein